MLNPLLITSDVVLYWSEYDELVILVSNSLDVKINGIAVIITKNITVNITSVSSGFKLLISFFSQIIINFTNNI